MTQEFIRRCVAAAADLALFYVGTPEAEMLVALHGVRANLEAELAEPFGPDVAAQMAQAFVAAVIGRKREIEAAGGTSPMTSGPAQIEGMMRAIPWAMRAARWPTRSRRCFDLEGKTRYDQIRTLPAHRGGSGDN